jgi:hypothetical protein
MGLKEYPIKYQAGAKNHLFDGGILLPGGLDGRLLNNVYGGAPTRPNGY